MHTATDTELAIANWLARALGVPEVAHSDWREQRLTMLPTGRLFDAVRMPRALVHAAIGSTAADVVTRTLAELLDGPVICDRQTWYYALVPPRTTEDWASSLAQCRGRGGWLGVPSADRTQPRGVHWAVLPRSAGDLCTAEAVAALLAIGRDRLEASS
ncbi:hypothetical protein SLUN_08200 [Streptomyces lunaelactis]|uniref:Uncharacterized protein n=1 Tax=Streptomyces lunaelactis TaxID=1535768 RepID=A0A2R4SZ62_9ACTN|nr:hypothetical protein [Streptomyces lunaelactis]AVZ72185.1 hypothetical protein SLUN_08200 [Streptomyces lunaelactis]NUK87828.1 hypothetical protein [Streptomyces lunaelactis]